MDEIFGKICIAIQLKMLYNYFMAKRINVDLTDQKVNMLKVVCRGEDKVLKNGERRRRWLCQCDCGKEALIYESSLLARRVKSCGCMKYAALNKAVDLTGREVNGIRILKRVDDEVQKDGSRITKWLCQCQCGSLFVTRGTSITSGHTKSCGCRKKQLRVRDEEMIGKSFNRLTVRSRGADEITPNGLRFIRWNCECECGAWVLVRGSSLRDGHAISCGCERYRVLAHSPSYGEQWISEYLTENGYAFESQKHYADLRGPGGGCLFYDFLVHFSKGDVLIECQGRQHYEPVGIFGGVDNFESQQVRDELKRAYALFINVPLFEIDYSVTKQDFVLSQLKDIIQQFN